MMGAEGLKKASQVAILNANYIASRLQDAFPVLYTGRDGRVAHECILDIRPLKEETGHQRAGYCQAPDRLRFPRADHVVPGGGYADG